MRGWNGKPVKKRLWRGGGLPRDCDATDLDMEKMKPFPLDLPGYSIVYQRPQRFISFCDPGSPIKYRKCAIAIRHDGELVGLLDFVEFRLDPTVDNDDLWEWLDGYSAYYGELAAMLAEQWDDVETDVAAYGPIVLFDNVWMRADHAKDGMWRLVARKAFDKLFSKRSIAIFKPFPLEYEGTAELAPIGYKRRMAALRRVASREENVYPMPEMPGLGTWLWSPRPDLREILVENTRLARKLAFKLGRPVAIRWSWDANDRALNDNW